MDARDLLFRVARTAVAAADPYQVVISALGKRPSGNVVVAGAGKAAARMAKAVEDRWADVSGIVVTRAGYEEELSKLTCLLAKHPVPDHSSRIAATSLMELAQPLNAGDTMVFLASGGASALLCAPIDGITFRQKKEMMRRLLISGASIEEINFVRSAVSKIKGGGLGRMAAPANIRTIVVSDVAGDNAALVGSGPSIFSWIDYPRVRDIIRQYGLSELCDLRVIARHASEWNTSAVEHSRHQVDVVLTSEDMLRVVEKAFAKDGVRVINLGGAVAGDARETAKDHLLLALAEQGNLSTGDQPVILISGGECTVAKKGDGVGGPNAEYALAFAKLVDGSSGISVIACDTDGVDGGAEVAGAFADSRTISRAASLGISANQALENNDAHAFFERLNDQLITGPTGTNLNDFRAILVQPRREGGARDPNWSRNE